MIPLDTLNSLYEYARWKRDSEDWTDEEREAYFELLDRRGPSYHKFVRIGNQQLRRRGLSRHYCKGRSRHAQRMLKFLEHVRRRRRIKRNWVRNYACPIGCGKTFSEFYEFFEQSTHKQRHRNRKKGEL